MEEGEDKAARELHKLVKTDNYRCLALLLQPPVDHGASARKRRLCDRVRLEA